jgi:hypothetical protein
VGCEVHALTLLAAAILATFAPPRIQWLPCLVVTPENEVVKSHRPVVVTPPPAETPMDVLRAKAR